MRHAVMARHGPPALLEVVEAAAPEPGEGEVRVAVETAGVSPADLLICWGLHPEARRPPFTPGWDVIGVVEAVGDDVTAVKVGDRVAALTIVGGYATHVVTREADLVPVPGGVDPLAAQCLPFDGVVAYQMLVRVAGLSAGDTAFVQGALGNIARCLAELCAARGIRLVGTVDPARRGEAEASGIVAVDRGEGAVEAVLRACPGGVHAAFDGIGHTLWSSSRVVRRGGILVGYGHAPSVSGGKRNWPRFLSTVGQYAGAFAVGPLGGRRASLYSIQELRRSHPGWYRADLAELFRLLSEGALRPRVHGSFPLEHARQALELVDRGEARGKVVLTMR